MASLCVIHAIKVQLMDVLGVQSGLSLSHFKYKLTQTFERYMQSYTVTDIDNSVIAISFSV